jgi:hypothetical protein
LEAKLNTQKKPWQVAPSEFVEHAIEHANRNNDFDKQMAFLVLDIGVENTLKTYLDKYEHKEFERIKKEAAKEVSFFAIVTAVKELASGKIPEFDSDKILGFHEQRNDLYHNKTRLNPPDDDLKNYINIAKTMLKALLDVDVDKLQEQGLAQTNHSSFLVSGIRKNIISLQSNSSIIVEHLYPPIATRTFAAQLKHIRVATGPDDMSYLPSVRAEFSQQRIDAFNKITGWEFTEDNHEFVEYIIDNPQRLHVWLVLQEINSNDWSKMWEKYQEAIYFLEHEQVRDNKTEDKKGKEIYEWTHEKADIVCQWIKARIPDVDLEYPDWNL